MFDAIWTAALALNKTESQLRKRNLSLKNFTYKDEYGISDIIYEEALKLKFFGLSVSMHADVYTCALMKSWVYCINLKSLFVVGV